MRIIGLTGGIACGKSTVSYHLRELGARILDADAIAHALMAPGGKLYELYLDRFGEGILQPDATLDRRAIGRIVFSDPAERAWMDSVAHPMVRSTMTRELEEAREYGTRIAVLDVPLLFEAGWQDFADENWVVAVDEKTQLRRLMKRDACTEEAARGRIRAQMLLEEKIRLADVVIDNGKSVDHTYAQVDKLWKERLDG